MIDAYSKIVLTVIAVALSGIFVQGVIRGASAQLGGSCGSRSDPCYVRNIDGALNVNVMNWPGNPPTYR